jgi:RimJ/RimL family protein N-acetyltransferase
LARASGVERVSLGARPGLRGLTWPNSCRASLGAAFVDFAVGVSSDGLDVPEDWPGGDKIEVGFELHKAWWGRGLATEGALAALRFGFEHHGLER